MERKAYEQWYTAEMIERTLDSVSGLDEQTKGYILDLLPKMRAWSEDLTERQTAEFMDPDGSIRRFYSTTLIGCELVAPAKQPQLVQWTASGGRFSGRDQLND